MAGGAVGSVGLMVLAGRHTPRFLLFLFVLWVASPFLVLIGASVMSKPWPAPTRAALYIVTVVVALGSLAIYGDVAYWRPRARPAPFFVMVPPLSWLLTAIVVAIAALASRRRT